MSDNTDNSNPALNDTERNPQETKYFDLHGQVLAISTESGKYRSNALSRFLLLIFPPSTVTVRMFSTRALTVVFPVQTQRPSSNT